MLSYGVNIRVNITVKGCMGYNPQSLGITSCFSFIDGMEVSQTLITIPKIYDFLGAFAKL